MDILPLVGAAGPIAQAVGGSAVLLKVIERVADHIGLSRRPDQILREGEAQAYADAKTQLIKQSLDPGATEDERLLARGLLAQTRTTMREQGNREAIVLQALPEVKDDAKPEDVEDDWFANFFDKSRLVSDEEMQQVWARLLAGEINKPGTFSRRTITLLSSFDRKDAIDFLQVCQYSSTDDGKPSIPLIYDSKDEFFRASPIKFHILENLDSMGVIKHNHAGFLFTNLKKDEEVVVDYFSTRFVISFPDNWDGKFLRGHVMFTDLGYQLARLCSPEPVEDFVDYLIGKWKGKGCKVTIHRPNQPPQEV